ncbi:unnamed protein product [Cylindrotheca closterium]|uniref:Uncharacterized protein n=1 Tax=Cylindrotheca closterium TaxID=2856 RepID=A0AAD2FIX4_9STRA|nr:unnamed protein product [Cylindrotheca closterium]
MHGLRQAENELDVHNNVGSRVLDEEGFLGRFPPPVYYDEDGIANVFAMCEMIAAGYRITMDTAGLGMTAKMATVRKNKEGFTPRQVKAAMEARSAMHILNTPSTKSLKYAIRSGLIKNCPITEEAINHAKAIFGPDAFTLKGKSTRPTPKKDYEPEDEDERDFNLRGQFDDIHDSERNELLADADNDVDDMPELAVRVQGDDNYESDDNDLGDEGNDEEEPIVADLDHHQENVDRGTNDVGSLVTDLEDLQ